MLKSILFVFTFFLTIVSLRKRTYQEEKMILMMILALLSLFATPFSNEFGGLVGVHGFYLPGVAPQGANFLRLFVLCLFFFAC